MECNSWAPLAHHPKATYPDICFCGDQFATVEVDHLWSSVREGGIPTTKPKFVFLQSKSKLQHSKQPHGVLPSRKDNQDFLFLEEPLKLIFEMAQQVQK